MSAGLKVLCRKQYQMLNAMGITYWSVRPTTPVLTSDKPLICATCLVLLPEKLSPEATLQKQTLEGMLKVLAVAQEELCVAWVHPEVKSVQVNSMIEAIAQWAPYTILVMGEKLAQLLLSSKEPIDTLRTKPYWLGENLLQITYHPAELEKAKEHKRKAYEDLLYLKKWIDASRLV